MQIALEPITSYNYIRSYQPGRIETNTTVYEHSLIVTPNSSVTTWTPNSYAELLPEHFNFLRNIPPPLRPQFVLLGTGLKMYLPSPEIRLALRQLNMGLEFMDTAAACRTYNLLVAENRNVAAALLIN